jgi:Histidine phosphatase superfamily (branch 1)
MDVQVSRKSSDKITPQRVSLEVLREQDFGSLECRQWAAKPTTVGGSRSLDPSQPGFKPKETHESMAKRMDTFLDDFIQPLLASGPCCKSTVVVVSHGIILSFLWRALLQRFGPKSVSLGPGVGALPNKPLEYLPAWSNTGFLELDIKHSGSSIRADAALPRDLGLPKPKLSGYQMTIKKSNGKDHLNNLKRARGGLGSSTFDAKQKNLEGFFKKPKIDEQKQKPG